MKHVSKVLAITLLILIMFGTMYVVVQQSQRSDANYPQIQLAEDGARLLNKGEKPNSLTQGRVDAEKSLAPFVIVYDKSGKIVSGNGYVDGKVPTVPTGVLRASDTKEYNAVTWQPDNDSRIASVTVKANNYYVLSGRSLKEVEKNTNKTLQITLWGGIASFFILSILYFTRGKRYSKSKK